MAPCCAWPAARDLPTRQYSSRGPDMLLVPHSAVGHPGFCADDHAPGRAQGLAGDLQGASPVLESHVWVCHCAVLGWLSWRQEHPALTKTILSCPGALQSSHKPHHRFLNPKLFDAFDGSVTDTVCMILIPLAVTAQLVCDRCCCTAPPFSAALSASAVCVAPDVLHGRLQNMRRAKIVIQHARVSLG